MGARVEVEEGVLPASLIYDKLVPTATRLLKKNSAVLGGK